MATKGKTTKRGKKLASAKKMDKVKSPFVFTFKETGIKSNSTSGGGGVPNS